MCQNFYCKRSAAFDAKTRIIVVMICIRRSPSFHVRIYMVYCIVRRPGNESSLSLIMIRTDAAYELQTFYRRELGLGLRLPNIILRAIRNKNIILVISL